MSEKLDSIRFKTPEELKEEEIERKIKERDPEGNILGGIIFEEGIDPETQQKKRYLYIGNPYEENPIITKLETYATKEEVEAIKNEIIPMKESYEILDAMARTYKHRQPLLIEGPTALGKTYLVEKFTELRYGKGVKPLDFYCSGQTDVSELMAKWVPMVESEEDKKKWYEFLESLEARTQLAQIAQEVEEKTNLSDKQKIALIHTRLQKLAESAGLSDKTQWCFQYGAIPKSMGLIRNPDGTFSFDENKGEGFILHIEEVGLAEPQIIDALLKLRGKRGQLSNDIQLWENGGRKVKAGPEFWLVLTTNPPEEYPDRNALEPALARGVVFKRMGPLSVESLHLAADYYFTYKLGQKPEKKPEGCIFDIYNHPEIGKEISKIVAVFHNDLDKELHKGEKGRQQKIPLTLDDMARVADALIDEQVRNKSTGYVDLAESLKHLLVFYYLDRLADTDLKKRMLDNLNDLLEPKNIAGIQQTENILKGGGKNLPIGAVLFEDNIISRKELLNILVERASLSPDELDLEKRQRIDKKTQQLKHDSEDKIDSLLQNSNIPSYVKEQLKNARR